LALLSDPVTLARLHQRLWNTPERYPQWAQAYQALKPTA